MSDNKKIHSILEYICSSGNQSCFDTDQIASAINLPLSETNSLVRKLIDNGDANGYNDKDTSSKGAIGILKIVATKDAYETKKYFDVMEKLDNRFNVFVSRRTEVYNILDISETQLLKLVDAYSKGRPSVTIDGFKYWIKDYYIIKIFTYKDRVDFDLYRKICEADESWFSNVKGKYFLIKALEKLGKDVTEKFIGDFEFGEKKEIDSNTTFPANTPSNIIPTITTTVFIIHGHDEEMKRSVQLFLNRAELKDVVLHEQPDKSRTIIEKLIDEGANAGYVIALLSPDDVQGDGTLRARQNVILEIGYFIGKLGRDKVRLLKRGDTEVPSDLQGILFDTYDTAGAWRVKLAKELKSAGLPVNIENVITKF